MNIRSLMFLALMLSHDAMAVPTPATMSEWFTQPKPLTGWTLETRDSSFVLQPHKQGNQHGEVHFNQERQHCIISVPHRFYDKHTLTIGTALFQQVCQLLVTNTQHRHSAEPGAASMDYSKQLVNIHNAAIQGYTSLYPNTKVFQIHGFSRNKRSTTAGKNSDIILSQGHSNDVKLWQMQACFAAIGYRTKVYPQQVTELGGTRNVLHGLGIRPHHFIHIELSYQVRKQLVSNQQQLQQFSECVQLY